MIRVDFHNLIREETVVNVIALLAGISLIASQSSSSQQKNKKFIFDWRKKIDENNMAFISISKNGKTGFYYKTLMSEFGDRFLEVPTCLDETIGVLFTSLPPDTSKKESLRSLYFLDENTFTAAIATGLVKKIGGDLWINNKLKESYPINKKLADKTETNEVYFNQKNELLKTKPITKENMIDAMRKYSELNNNDESLLYVSKFLEHVEKAPMKTKKIVLGRGM